MKRILSAYLLLSACLWALPLTGAERIRERVYVSTDREVYVAGDAVWMSAWCLDASTGRLSTFSKTAYVEVHSADGMVQTAKIALEGGRGAGRLYLPTTLPTGNYRLLAYTKLGASEQGFDPLTGARTLSVFNTLSTARAPGVEVSDRVPEAASVPSSGALSVAAAGAAPSASATLTLENRGTEPVSFSLSVRHDDGIPAPAGSRIGDFVRDDQITDPLARQGKRFAVGITDDRICKILRKIRHLYTIISKLPVRFICQKIDRMPDSLLLVFQNLRQLLDRILRVDHPGRIVRRVDNHRLCLCCNLFLKLCKIRLKTRNIGRYRHDHTIKIRYIIIVFTEIRRKGNDLISRI